MVWHLGVRGQVDAEIAHHNIHFGGEWSTAFDALPRMTEPGIIVDTGMKLEGEAPDGGP